MALESTGHENTIHTPFKGAQHIKMIQFSGAGESNDFYAGGIGKPHDPRQIRGGKSTIVAGEGQHIRLPLGGGASWGVSSPGAISPAACPDGSNHCPILLVRLYPKLVAGGLLNVLEGSVKASIMATI